MDGRLDVASKSGFTAFTLELPSSTGNGKASA
jgi:hypothetical protein